MRDAADAELAGRYDLVTIFEALHDMSQPVEALLAARPLAGENGAVLERMMYAWSIFLCLPTGLASQPSAATGTVMRADTLRGYAEGAGFSRVEILPVEHEFFRLYRLQT